MSFQALIASGEEHLVRRVSAVLTEMGLAVESIPASDPALSLLRRRRFEAVFLDCDLEGSMSLVESMRQESASQRAIVLAFASGSEMAKSVTRNGANFVLGKPVNWEAAKRTFRAAQNMIIRERRRGIREKVSFVANIRTEESTMKGTITDLSDGGFAIKVPAEIPLGSLVEVHFKFSATAEPVSCRGIVSWHKGGAHGLEFSYVPPDSSRAIIKWLVCHSHHRIERLVIQRHSNQALDWGF